MSDGSPYQLSVVIPTHNRCAALLRTLDALCVQTTGPDAFEVIVVIDAGTDDTLAALDGRRWPFRLVHRPAVGRGAASARNTGAAIAQCDRIVFLDDDIVADPGFLAAHLAAGERHVGSVVVGQSAPFLAAGGWFGATVTEWWIGRFREMAKPGYRFGFTDVMSGNMSLPQADFISIGGFDASLKCREDYELGFRLISSGVRVIYAPNARGLHHDASTPKRNLVRAQNEGAADYQIAEKHPALFPWLRCANMTANTHGAKLLGLVCFRVPSVAHILLSLAAALLSIFEGSRLFAPWQRLNILSRALAYQLGVASAAKNFAALEALRNAAPAVKVLSEAEIDLLDGMSRARERLAIGSVAGLNIRIGPELIARMHAAPGLEPINTRHLDALLCAKVSQWALTDEAAVLLSPVPAEEPDWLSEPGTTLPMRGKGVAELDLADWSVVARSDVIGFPLRVLVRFAQQPLGWVRFDGKPAAGMFWSALRLAVLTDHDICGRLVRIHRIARPHRPERPPISVVVCTRDRTETLRRCLAALLEIDYPDYEILIVDNAPSSPATERLLTESTGLRYVREDRPGLNWARNRGIAAARHDIIAFTDDDTQVDRHWLSGIASAFADREVDFITGLVVPMKLDTAARLYFEDVYGGMGKGFDAVTHDPIGMWPHDLLWASALGVGANMAFRRRTFETAGHFDPALDVGTATRGGGDIEMFHRALSRGSLHVYEPGAFVWHEHRAEFDGLRQQLTDNGSGFASYLLACLRNRTVSSSAVFRFAIRAWLWDQQIKRLIRPRRHRRDFVWAEIVGLIRAPRRWRDAQAKARALEPLEATAVSAEGI
ncbi:glycosyltransferase [Silicimonas algicola]|uniref:GT2 family glycosyltransferase n=1 Tax=Silicimonas algicola TaxID=1826607 RepID=A0A316GB24_9RHOB|nr:glycosyltransferase [Silicimonas algicola]AZQ67208.1 glycosyltransferase [Silicimonas algicola]PWK56870.1 GT2 family glycosyltransferase [Silicimonas algicola]